MSSAPYNRNSIIRINNDELDSFLFLISFRELTLCRNPVVLIEGRGRKNATNIYVCRLRFLSNSASVHEENMRKRKREVCSLSHPPSAPPFSPSFVRGTVVNFL